TMLDLVEIPSPWSDSERLETPLSMEFSGLATAVDAAESIIFSPYRAPYNKFPEYVEPGRVNLNTIADPNIFQGLGHNVLTPTDVDFQPTSFGGPDDIDHDQDGIAQPAGERTLAGASVAAAWNLFSESRRGYTAAQSYYAPGYDPDMVLSTLTGVPQFRFNPN